MILVVAGFAACDGKGDDDATSNTGGEKVFTYGVDSNSATFDPASDLQTKSGLFFVKACGDTLWSMDESGEMTMKLAESIEWNEDNTLLTIKLREGVKFSNGNDLTAEDVVYTLNHLLETPRTESMFAWMDPAGTTTEGDYIVKLSVTQYDASFVDTLSGGGSCILDKEYCEANPGFGWFVGTGPYMLQGDGESDKSGWEESVQYTLVRNPDYWGDAPYYDKLICKFYSEESTRYSEMMAGTIDAAYFSQATYINNARDNKVPDASLISHDVNSVMGLSMAAQEGSSGLLADINLRKAIAHAIDTDTIVSVIGEDVFKVADSVLPPSNWAYESQSVYAYDPKAAEDYLKQSGYDVSKPLRIVCESSALNQAVAEAVQANLAEIGLTLDMSGLGDFGTILPRLIENDLEIGITGVANGSGADPASCLQQLGPMSNNGLLRSTDPELINLFNEGQGSSDKAQRTAAYKKFQKLIHDGYYFIPMWVDSSNYIVLNAHAGFDAALDANGFLDPTLLTD
jgi:peptide/nickel transport system substrate-binding protein